MLHSDNFMIRLKRRRNSILSFFFICTMLSPGFTPALTGPQEETPKFGVRVDVVSIDVEVLDQTGEPVENLTQEDFVVLENGREMEIANFNRLRDRPVSLVLLLDVSTIEREKLSVAKQYILNIIHLLDPKDDISLYVFDKKEVYPKVDFTTARPSLTEALNDVYASNRMWNFMVEFFGYDPPTGSAIDQALNRLPESAHSKKAMLVISNRFKGLGPVTVDHVQESGCTFYTLVFEHKMAAVATMGGNVINREEMTEGTGGREFKADSNDIMGVSRSIAASMKNYYSVGYRTEIEEGDTKPRRIEVRIPGGDFTINARESYIPKE